MDLKPDFFNLADYDYLLPQELIAQEPLSARDQSRLLVVNRASQELREVKFSQVVDLFDPGDVLVLNDTKVIKARLQARRASGAKVEVLLIKERQPEIWEALVKPGKRALTGEKLVFGQGVEAQVVDKGELGLRTLRFNQDIRPRLDFLGRAPTPPYIKSELDDPQKYQTVYAANDGAIAAPTAGFHFTSDLLRRIENKGVKTVYVTLHCGLGTFRPVTAPDIRQHQMAGEWVRVDQTAAEAVNTAKDRGQRVIAVGTTCVRVLESAAVETPRGWRLSAYCQETGLYILPGYQFKIVDALLTNFHTPCSTNLVLVSVFCGLQRRQEIYRHAIKEKFRFFSFGDAMFIR